MRVISRKIAVKQAPRNDLTSGAITPRSEAFSAEIREHLLAFSYPRRFYDFPRDPLENSISLSDHPTDSG